MTLVWPRCTQPIFMVVACSVMCYRTKGALWALLFTASSLCGLCGSLGVPAKLDFPGWYLGLAGSSCVILCGLVLLVPGPAPKKQKAN